MHLPFEQHPSVQLLFAQHVSPRLPHLAHTPSPVALLQALPGLHRSAALGQHASPELPHEIQVPPLQVSPS
jgi:hypothetical protein